MSKTMSMQMAASIRAPGCGVSKARSSARASRSALRVRAFTEKDSEVVSYAKSLPGISQPFPNMFDPLSLSVNATGKGEIKRWRESELTHGRVAMLAALGYIAQEQLPDFPLFPDAYGPAINQFQQVEAKGAIFWEPLVLAIGLAESFRVSIGWANPTGGGFNQLLEEYNPGELGFDPLGLRPKNPAAWADIQTKELNNGRLAMIGVAGMTAQELVDGKPIFSELFRNTLETGVPLPTP